jgi:hypothetical protein
MLPSVSLLTSVDTADPKHTAFSCELMYSKYRNLPDSSTNVARSTSSLLGRFPLSLLKRTHASAI